MTGRDTRAPDDLEVVRRFINTLDIEDGTDLLEDIEGCGMWLREQGLLTIADTFTAIDVEQVCAFREALRDLLAARHDHADLSPELIDSLNQVAIAARLTAVIGHNGWSLEPQAHGSDGALGRLVVMMLTAISDGTWDRLHVCDNDQCRWAFYDHSRSHTGRWCSMSICGNRAKQNSWRARQVDSTT